MIQNNKNIFQKEIDRINSGLSDNAGFSRLPSEKKAELEEKAKKVFLKKIFLEIIEKLNREDQERFRGIIENQSSPMDMEAFLKSRISDYEEIARKVTDTFIEKMEKEI